MVNIHNARFGGEFQHRVLSNRTSNNDNFSNTNRLKQYNRPDSSIIAHGKANYGIYPARYKLYKPS